MHKGIVYITLMLALLLAPLRLAAQETGGPHGGRSGRGQLFTPAEHGPVPFLLRNRAELRLTADQVVKLQEIDGQVEVKNRPVITQLVEIRRQLPRRARGQEPTPEERQRFEAQMKAAEPLLKQIDENWKFAMRQVGQVLTDEQKGRIPALLANEKRIERERDQRRRGNVGRD